MRSPLSIERWTSSLNYNSTELEFEDEGKDESEVLKFACNWRLEKIVDECCKSVKQTSWNGENCKKFSFAIPRINDLKFNTSW
jgi:hypothetical protein